MKIDRFINRVFDFLLGRRADGEAKLYFHSQNLNEDRRGDVKGWPYHGRCWLRTGNGRRFHFSWNLWTHFCGLSVEADAEDGGTMFHIAFPPISFWFSLPIGFKKHQYSHHVYFNIRVFDWAIWWQFGGDSMSWSSTTPKWKNGNFHPIDFVFGDRKYASELLSKHDVLIPMPEGNYKATVELTLDTWKRPRSPFTLKRWGAKIDVPIGIPHQGKGENSWDCGEDRSYGLSCSADTVSEAIGKMVECALNSRRKYDGDVMAKYPDPANYVPPTPTPSSDGGQAAAC